MFKDFKLLWCRFYLAAGDDGLTLPPLKSTLFFDDQFKHALRQQVCKFPGKDCSECLLKNDCAYFSLYEDMTGSSWTFRRFGALPPPLVWQPPLEKKTDFFPGEKVVFNLVLCGRGIAFLKYLVNTMLQLAQDGLDSGAGSFELDRVVVENPFSGTEQELLGASADDLDREKALIRGEEIENWADRYRHLTKLSIRFLTPLLIKDPDQYLQDPHFAVIMKGLFQRATALYYFYHRQHEMEIDYNEFKDKSRQVKKVKDQTRFVPAGQATRKAQLIPGILGEAVYMGEFELFLPFLKLAEWIHLGEQAAYGLGRIQVKVG